MANEKEILVHFLHGESQRSISRTLQVSRNTVSKVVTAYQVQGLDPGKLPELPDDVLHQKLFPDDVAASLQTPPDYAFVHKELLKDGVTLKQLWEEYVMDCRETGKLYFRYTQFCKKYRDYVSSNRLTMHIHHKPGERLMVDWAGTTIPLYNPVTGAISKTYMFVCTLPFSMYCYAEVFPDMKEESWIQAHIHALAFFGGSTRLLVPDNLTTGIVSNRKYEDPVVNKAYQELADHYGMTILPARVLTPKDKAAVEGSVGQLTTHIIGKLRNHHFFSLYEINSAVDGLLKKFNKAPFQKKDGSRYSVFLTEELPFLQPLPRFPYEYAEWRKATVQLNYHITVDHQNYSVPFRYVHKRVDVRLTSKVVEIYYEGTRIASHRRLTGRWGQYDTITEHMPPNHQLYSQWDGNRFRRWAKKCGPSAEIVVNRLLSSYRVEEQAYKGCIGLLKLSEKYGTDRLDKACRLALEKMPVPRYKLVKGILDEKLDIGLTPEESECQTAPQSNADDNSHAFVRGAAYYGGDHHEE